MCPCLSIFRSFYVNELARWLRLLHSCFVSDQLLILLRLSYANPSIQITSSDLQNNDAKCSIKLFFTNDQEAKVLEISECASAASIYSKLMDSLSRENKPSLWWNWRASKESSEHQCGHWSLCHAANGEEALHEAFLPAIFNQLFINSIIRLIHFKLKCNSHPL